MDERVLKIMHEMAMSDAKGSIHPPYAESDMRHVIRLYSDARAEIAEKDAEISDAWCTAFNLWPGEKEPSDPGLVDVIFELDRRYKEQIAALTKDKEYLLSIVKLAYRKHHLNDDSIGWSEFDDNLLDALCNIMGEDGYDKWIKGITRRE